MDKSTANFFRASVNDRLLLIENEVVEVKLELSKISIKIDKIIDFLQRKESNRGYLIGSYKTDFDEGDCH